MSRNKIRIMRPLLAALLILCTAVTLAACNAGGDTATTAAATTTAATTAAAKTTAAATTTAAKTTAAATTTPPDSTKYEITYFVAWAHLIGDDELVERMLQDKLNIEIILKHVDWQSQEQYNLMFTSGEMPDAGNFGKSNQFMHYDEELARTIPMDLIREYCPSFVQVYDEDPLFWTYVYTKEDKNQAYGLPAVSETYGQLYLWTDFYRYDWIQELGLDMGTKANMIADNFYVTDGAVPIGNFESILRAFKAKGSNIIPATWNGGIPPELLSPFGITNDIVNNNGEPDQYYVTEAYRECLTWLAGLYKEGLIDPEFPTQDRTVWWDKVNTGVAGYFPQSSNALNSWANGRPPLSTWQTDKNVVFIMTPGVGDAQGKYVSNDYAAATNGGQTFFVNADVTDEGKLIRILQLFEYSNFPGDPETLATFTYGKKGVNWEWSKDRENWPVLIGDNNNPQVEGAMTFCSQMEVYDYWKWITLEPLFEKGGEYYVKSMGGKWNTAKVLPYVTDILGETDIIQVSADAPNLGTIVGEFRNGVIMGTMELNDSTWAAYLAELNAAGYGKVRAEYQKMRITEELLAEYSD